MGNNSAFGFYQGKKFRGLNSTSNNKHFAKTNNDHSALKQFAIEQLCKFDQPNHIHSSPFFPNFFSTNHPKPIPRGGEGTAKDSPK